MEDDVVTTRGFITEIKKYASDASDEWHMVEFSELGLIGKFFRNRDLPLFFSMFNKFSSYQPVDYLHNYVLRIVNCDPAKDEVNICN